MSHAKARSGEAREEPTGPPAATPPVPPGPDATSTDGAPPAGRAQDTLHVDIVWGDLTMVEGDVFAVGHYIGVLPLNAELSLDRKLSNLPDAREGDRRLFITDQTARGAIRGALGETVLLPWPGHGHVALAGMGRPGAFREAELRVLAQSLVSTTVRLLDQPTLCCVVIGSGIGNLPVSDAAQALVRGALEALAENPGRRLKRIRLIERELDKALDVLDAIGALRDTLAGKGPVALAPHWVDDPDKGGGVSQLFACSMALARLADVSSSDEIAGRLGLDALLEPLPPPARASLKDALKAKYVKDATLERLALGFRLERPREVRAARIATRVSFLHDSLQLRQAAITNRTTTTERMRDLPPEWLDRIVDDLQSPPIDTAESLGAKAWRRLVHTDLKEPLAGESVPLVLEVDPNMARVPWELIRDGEAVLDAKNPAYLGLLRPVARQLRTTYSPRVHEGDERRQPKALVIGDPDDSLEIAVDEARQVRDWLTKLGFEVSLRIGAPDGNNKSRHANVAPAGLYEVLGDLLDGEFDLVHYCGHAEFNERFPSRSGWRFANGAVLTPSMLEGIDRPPRVVVANACQSSVTAVPAVEPAEGSTGQAAGPTAIPIKRFGGRFLPGLADEFFRRGVSDFIGTAWEVRDFAAKLFAETFYNALIGSTDMSLGEAVRLARKALYDKRTNWRDDGALWAAYQHYGDPTRMLRLRPMQGRS